MRADRCSVSSSGFFECHRCGAKLEPVDSLDLAGWLIRCAWEDGKVLAVCPACQRPDEREILALLHE